MDKHDEINRSFKEITDRANELHIEKNNHFKSQFLEDGELGVIIRIKDKLNDVKNGGKPSNKMLNKKLEDWLDIINYGVEGAICCVEEKTDHIKT